MSFLLGLMIGAAVFSGPGDSQNPLEKLNSIPLRCLALAENKQDEYRDCRRESMFKELNTLERCMGGWGRNRECERSLVDKNIAWEIETLQKLAAAGRERSNVH